MSEPILHQRENNEESENHLKDNGQKFNRHCVETLRLLYRGLRLNARQLETEYKMDGRRLRDIFKHRSDCKRQWVKSKNGVTQYVEYWLDIPGLPTKHELIQKADNVIKTMKSVSRKVNNIQSNIQQPFL